MISLPWGLKGGWDDLAEVRLVLLPHLPFSREYVIIPAFLGKDAAVAVG